MWNRNECQHCCHPVFMICGKHFATLIFFIILYIMNSKHMRSHDDNRVIVCAACGKKDNKCGKITPALEKTIQIEVNKAYSVGDIYFPNGVCGQCRKWLFASKKGDIVPETVRERWNSIDFSGFRPPSRSTPCSCLICKRARFTGAKLEASEQADLPRKQTDEPKEAEASYK